MDDTKILFQLRSDQEESFTAGKSPHSTLWTKVAVELSNITGTAKTATHCINKWKALKREWRKTADHNKTSGNERRSCPLYEDFQLLYGERACERPTVLIDSFSEEREVPQAANDLISRINRAQLVRILQTILNTDDDSCILLQRKQNSSLITIRYT